VRSLGLGLKWENITFIVIVRVIVRVMIEEKSGLENTKPIITDNQP
jgi:hypothetical protein